MSKSKQKRDYILFVEDILTCIEKIERYANNISFEEFCENDMAVTDKFLTNIGAHLAQAASKKDMRRIHSNRRIVPYNILYAMMRAY